MITAILSRSINRDSKMDYNSNESLTVKGFFARDVP